MSTQQQNQRIFSVEIPVGTQNESLALLHLQESPKVMRQQENCIYSLKF